MTTPDPTAALQRFLALAADPESGAALYDALAPEAMLVVDGTVVPRAHVTRDAYAQARRAAGPGRRFEGVALTRVEPADADTHVAWFEATEAETGTPVAFAAGLRGTGVEWLHLDKAPAPLTFAQGRMQMLADYAFIDGAGLKTPGSWLEVGFFRHHALPRPKLLILDDARFGCQSSAGCCTVNFRIEVPAAAQHAIDAIDWSASNPALEGTRLEPIENGDLLLKPHGERCRFLDAENRCEVHKAVGRAIFPVCAQYPFTLTHTPDGLAVASSYACSTVRANFGPTLAERADDLYERAAMAPAKHVTTFKLAEGHAVDWDEFAEAEETFLDLLDRDDLPLHRRLWVMGRLLVAWCTDEPTSIGAIEGEAIPASEGPMKLFQGRMVSYFASEFTDPAYREARDVSHGQPLGPEAALVGMFKNLLHSRSCSFYMSLAATYNLMVVGYLLALQVQGAKPAHPLDGAAMRELSIMIMHGKFLALTAGLTEQGINPRELLGDPTFGLGFLSYPSPAAVGAPESQHA